MKIKYSFIPALLICAAIQLDAQSTERIRFSVLGGVNFQNLNGKDYKGDKLDNKMIIGYHAGFNVLLPVVPEFYFQPGLLFTTKGAKSTSAGFSSTYKLAYIEMPLNFVYRAVLGKGHFLLGFGPYLAYGIKGTHIVEMNQNTNRYDMKFANEVPMSDSTNSANYIRAFDAGGNIFAGYETSSGIYFQLNTQFGMLNINPENKQIPNNKTAVKNTGFGLSLGYRF